MKPLVFNGGTLARKEIYGVQRNTLEILYELDKQVERDAIELLIPANSAHEYVFENIRVVKWRGDTNTTVGRNLWTYRQFPDYVRRRCGVGIDLLLALPTRNCEVVSVYDCTTELFPQNATNLKSKLSRQLYIHRVRKVLRNCKLVFTVSESAKKDLVRLYNRDPQTIVVTYGGWQHLQRVEVDERIIDELGLRDTEYFFSLGSRFAHKNFRWVVEAARQNPTYRFVVTGSSLLNSSDRDLDASQPENITFTSYLSDSQIKALMGHCKAFIQPSLYEGFGIPPMEAMSVGASCIVARAGSLPEIYGDSVRYIDPTDYDHIDLDSILSKPVKENNEVILERYSWKRSAEIVLHALRPFME